MATAAMGIFNQATTTAQGLTGSKGAQAADSTTGSSGTSGSNGSSDAGSGSATISANDFLTLLVTEMQNQDPTATQDPNEYINQLVEVNSLQQLIGINQTLTTDLGAPPTSTGNGTAGQAAGATAGAADDAGASTAGGQTAGQKNSLLSALQSVGGSGATTSQAATNARPNGNLSVPGVNPSALRVAHALDGRMRGVSAANGFSGIH